MSIQDAPDATGEGGKHGKGRSLVDAARRARAEGKPEADLLDAEAEHTDPQAVANALDQDGTVREAAERESAEPPAAAPKD